MIDGTAWRILNEFYDRNKLSTWDYDVVVYLGTLPKIKNHNIKVQVMRAFGEGAARCGVRCWLTIIYKTENYTTQD